MNEDIYLIATNSTHGDIPWDSFAETSPPKRPEEIRKLFDTGIIDGLTNVFKPGWTGWKPLSEVEELKSFLVTEEAEESGAGSPDSQVGQQASSSAEQNGKKRKRQEKRPAKNTGVFVKGLPEDITEEDFAKYMKRAGVIKVNPDTLKPHVKLYKDDEGKLTGEGLVIYGREESVEIALKYLDQREIAEGYVISVEKASFKPKEKNTKDKKELAIDEELRKKRRLAAKIEEQRLRSWAEETPAYSATKKASSVLLLRPCWTEEHCALYSTSAHFYVHIAELVKAQLVKMNTAFKRVVPIPRHPQGVVCIKFKSSEEAEAFIEFCQKREVDISPLRAYPGLEDQPSTLTFYDGKSDLRAQAANQDESYCFAQDTDLDAFDRLWLQSCGLPQQALLPTAAQQAAITKQIKEADDETKLEEFGNWLEAQSSDEEFAIQAEGGVGDDDEEDD
eukprot:Blabericola_migrator_1__11674@NODE_703_length_6798_cov_75_067301_g511_i0_p3_GENE_NODE_703_length_6798_cov_75_067301_g511_i0NODE_703_length_6798_cov_75_067301_g511_i0_p3_ORF_typecomplete_len448_score109_50RRM_1/PF00076_22/3_6e09RRM_1/PF00076_22/3_5GYF_2/PF14237_6/7_7e07RRM_7/PF16367_5/5_7e05RRM_7/PF16367_5/3_3e02ChaC/PF04752_12/0_14ChaC/PF04752_12/7_1e03DUF3006/PF11213_8/1_1e04DUF3006/PF11213_8/0_95_NODE_703_length_6798_cov_75_067301_g511_i036154958